jgi:hypothetical protein
MVRRTATAGDESTSDNQGNTFGKIPMRPPYARRFNRSTAAKKLFHTTTLSSAIFEPLLACR